MQDHVYKLSEIVGTSRKGVNEAIESGLARARESIRNIRWFEVGNIRGYIEPDGAVFYQVALKIGFTLEG